MRNVQSKIEENDENSVQKNLGWATNHFVTAHFVADENRKTTIEKSSKNNEENNKKIEEVKREEEERSEKIRSNI